MTKVTWLVVSLLIMATLAVGQDGPTGPLPELRSAGALYERLSTVGLDKARTYKIREASFNRAALHITLNDGTIAFTEDVAGHVTGAFFEGDGEILLFPPDQTERASMMLFTGAAILEEGFVSAYFRFNDATFAELQPYLRPTDHADDFVQQWNETTHNLAAGDALRLLSTFSQLLPVSGTQILPGGQESSKKEDRMFHGRVQGKRLGTFDVFYDSQASEQIWAGQSKAEGNATYYDLWTSFALIPPGMKPETEPGANDGGNKDADITVVQYRIRADVKPPTDLSAEAWIQMDVRRGGQRAIQFELSRFLKIRQLDADGKPVEFIHNPSIDGSKLSRRGNDRVAVVFPRPLRSGEKLALHFVYAGSVLSEAGAGLLYVGARGTWYPNWGLATSNFELEFHYPAGWTLVATGKRVEAPAGVAPAAEGAEQVTRWISERPIPLAGFNLGKYTRAAANAGDVVVETYAASGVERNFPKTPQTQVVPVTPDTFGTRTQPMMITSNQPSPARNAQMVADTSARAIEFYSKRFGPYPYGGLKLTQMPGALSQGWPGLVFLSSLSFLTDTERGQLQMSTLEKTSSTAVISHETAHQWWGDLVGWSGYRDQWIIEALADYSSLMFLESRNPSQSRTMLARYKENLLEKNKDGAYLMDAGPVSLGSRLSSSHFPDGYEAISYGRGTWLFHMLRCMMRDAEQKPSGRGTKSKDPDEPFVRALRKVRERYEGKALGTRELLQVFEEELPRPLWYEGKKSLDWFYTGWVNGISVPQFELQGVKYADAGNTTSVTGTILMSKSAPDLVTPVPVYAVSGKNTVLLGRVFVDGDETQFRLSAPRGTRKVVLDPNQTLLARIK